ncbi:MAG: uroporphyrinogen decarboxylase family protein [Coprococcus sp.]
MITTDPHGCLWSYMLPEVHTDAQMMADLALASYQHGCFENVGVPFCMTIEAEELGAKSYVGSKIFEPHERNMREHL